MTALRAVPDQPDRVEVVTDVEGDVEVRHVRLRSPLPADFPEHPEGIESLNYLRYRLTTGPADAADADAILVMHPGAWGGAHSLDRLARNLVRGSARHGLTIEFWSLARRSDGGTDLTGIFAAREAGDPSIAVNYYFGGKQVDGQTFEGFRRGRRLRYLAELGLEQAVRDQYELMTRELPAPEGRRAKVFTGGHSLGGFIAGAFAGWDFDGTPGHDLIDGLIALDTLASADPLGWYAKRWPKPLGVGASVLQLVAVSGLRLGVAPRTTSYLQFARPKGFLFLHLIGLAGLCDGDQETDQHRRLPETPFFNVLLRALVARSYLDLVRRNKSMRRLRLTGHGLLGHTMGSQFLPIDALQVAFGSSDGPTLPRKTVPVPHWLRRVPGVRKAAAALFSAQVTEVPFDTTALYGWEAGGPVDMEDFARQVSGGPLSYVETYFPFRLHIDLILGAGGARMGSMRNLRHTVAAAAKPTLVMMADMDRLVAYLCRGVRALPPHRISAQGYSHIDVIAAADRPGEPVNAALLQFLVHEAPAQPGTVAAGEDTA